MKFGFLEVLEMSSKFVSEKGYTCSVSQVLCSINFIFHSSPLPI